MAKSSSKSAPAKKAAKPTPKASSNKPKAKLAPPPPAARAATRKAPIPAAKGARPQPAVKSAKPLRTERLNSPERGLSAPVAAAPPAPPSPVPTDGKPRKNQAGLSPKELEHFRDLLLAKRREIVGDMSSMEREALRTGGGSNLSNLPIHMADMGTDNYEQEFTLGLMEKDRMLLRDINRALGKIQDGSYGICEGTGLPISKPRLDAQPWARYSIEHARKMERGGVR